VPGDQVVGRAQHLFAIEQDRSLLQIGQSVNAFEKCGFPAPAFSEYG
jgi:hypothetical protein